LTADVAAATAAVVAAEAAEQDLIDAIADKGGIINPADKAELDALKAAVDTAKGTAQTLVNALPDSESAKDALDLRLDAFTALTPPAVNDADSDGTIDSSVAAATAAVVAAEAAEQDLIDAIADKGGIINPADKAELDALKAAVDTAKGTAQTLVNALPDSESAKDALDLRLDAFTALTPPAVNDADSDGTIDSSVAAATAAVVAAEAAEQDLIDAIADKGGIINPADKAELDALKAAVDTAKGTAQTLVNALPDSESAKDALDLRLDAFTALTPPAVNDADSDGTIDSSVAAATAAVVAAEAAEQDLIDAIADKGGIINPADKAELDALKAAVDTAKGTAQTLVNALPDSESAKDALDLRLDAFTALTPPAVNDADSDGTIDSSVAAATAAVVAAEAAEQDLIDAIADKGGIINPADKAELDALKAAVDTAKGTAQTLVNALPDSESAKDALDLRLDAFTALTPPAVNDADSDGTIDSSVAAATAAVVAAEAAEQDLIDAIADKGGIINPADKAELDALKAAVDTAKGTAQTLVNALPDSESAKDALDLRLDAFTALTPPAVNDADSDGTIDSSVAAATAAVVAAEAAEQDLIDAIADKGGIINPADKAELDALKAAVDTAKGTAQTLVNALPDSESAKDALDLRLDAFTALTPPAVNDADSDGTIDSSVAAATAAVVAAEAAEQDLIDAIADKGGIINPADKAELDALKAAVDTAKGTAQTLVNALPDSESAKDALDLRLDAFTALTPPAVNDADSDGTIDSSVAAATAAVVAAEAAEQDLIDAIADKGGIINPADKAELDALKAAVDTAKGTAQTLVNALPDSESAKDALDLRLDAFTALTPPAVNDADSDGTIDSSVAAATAAVVAAEAAEQDLIDAIADKGGIINPADKAELDALKAAVDTAKGTAQTLVNALPDSESAKDALDLRLDAFTALTPPAVNDADSDGTIDSSVAAATAAVVAAEAAEQDLIDAIADKGGIINPADKAELDALKAAVDTAKGTAQTLVNALPDSESAKDALDLRLDAFTALTPPAVNDADSDGTIDSSVAAATAAVVAAEAAEQDLIDAIADKGGIINPADKAELDALKAAVDTAKGTAQTLVNALPDSESAKDALDLRLDAFTALTPPAVNDADSDGTIDSSVAAATAAVVAAEAAEQDLIDAIADKGGIINPADKAELDALKAAVDTAKGTAQTLVNALPDSEAAKQKML
jgi:ribonuclease HI